jgi:nucleoside-diphosphate-sugar epimerase
MRNMKILLTGSEGQIGKYFSSELYERGIDFVGFDLASGQDLQKPESILESISGCSRIIHLALASGDQTHNSMGVNLKGLFNLLSIAETNSIERILYLSSVDVLGIFKGESQPSYFPIDDEHPCLPSTEYGMTKFLGEEMCRSWSQRTGIPSIALRPPGVWFPETYDQIANYRRERPSYEWDPYWEYGAFIDVRDLFEVSLKALTVQTRKNHSRYLVSSLDITTSGRTSQELAGWLCPNVMWRETRGRYKEDPYSSLVDCTPAMQDLEWKPEYSWKRYHESLGIAKI